MLSLLISKTSLQVTLQKGPKLLGNLVDFEFTIGESIGLIGERIWPLGEQSPLVIMLKCPGADTICLVK